tara:strand:+ start:216 stop:1337 length:1122 start_codon:yes stop_codon:yes gene_type:complete
VIPFVDLKAQYAHLKTEIDDRISKVLAHGQFILGPEVTEFEQALASFTGVEHVIGVASGTDALQIALMAEGIGKGDAVFLPSFTFTATAEVVLISGAEPVFCEVGCRDFNIDVEDLKHKIERVIDEGRLTPRAVIAVDLFGLPADYSALEKVSEHHDLFLVGDGAQSLGARRGDKRVGALAPATITSFFPAKPLGCYGDGGALLTDDDERAAHYKSIRAHGKGEAKYDIVRTGLNSRLDTLQAAILLAKLTVFEEELEVRRRLADQYDDRLNDLVQTPLRDNTSKSAWAQYAILLDDRDTVAARLKEKGIPTAVYYPKPMHLQPAYSRYGDGEGSLLVSEDLSRRILCLPMHAYMDDAIVERICNTVRGVVGV